MNIAIGILIIVIIVGVAKLIDIIDEQKDTIKLLKNSHSAASHRINLEIRKRTAAENQIASLSAKLEAFHNKHERMKAERDDYYMRIINISEQLTEAASNHKTKVFEIEDYVDGLQDMIDELNKRLLKSGV